MPTGGPLREHLTITAPAGASNLACAYRKARMALGQAVYRNGRQAMSCACRASYDPAPPCFSSPSRVPLWLVCGLWVQGRCPGLAEAVSCVAKLE